MFPAVGLACMMAAVLLGVCPSEVAQAEGIMKLKDGFYLDELEDVTSLDLVQALVVNAADNIDAVHKKVTDTVEKFGAK